MEDQWAQKEYVIKSIRSISNQPNCQFFNWRKTVNNHLKNQYKKLFNKIDKLVYLKAPSFDCVFKWRLLQEQKMKLTSKNKKTMSKLEVQNFIMHYERITKQMMRDFPIISDLTVFLDKSHRSKKMKFY